jgi:hypothetical protein
MQTLQTIKHRSILPTVAVAPSLHASASEGILMRRNDTRTRAVTLGAISIGIHCKKYKKQCYKRNSKLPAEVV